MKTQMKGVSQQILKKISAALNQVNQSIQTLLETEDLSGLALESEPETQKFGERRLPNNQRLTGDIEGSVDVLEVQQTQASVHLAEAKRWHRRYEAAVRASNQVLYDYNVQTNSLEWDGDAAGILGYSTTDLGSRGVEFWQSIIHPEDRPRFAAALKSTLKQGKSFQNLEFRLQRKDGSYIWIQDNNEILMDEAGNPVRVIGLIADITHRKQAELEQQQLLKRLSDLEFALDQAAIVATTDPQGRITQVNDRFCEISQYSREELLGSTHKLINSGYHPPSFFQNLWQTISSGQVWKGEIRNRAKDGSEYWVDTVIVPFLDQQGQPFQYLAIRFEVTERKQAEAALRQSEERNRAILSAVPDIMSVISADGTYQNFSQNQFNGEVIALNQQSIVGLQIADVLPPEWAAAKLAAIQETLSSGELQVYEQQICFGDRIQYEEVRVVPYREDTVLCMVRNISARKRAELALLESQQFIQQIADSSPNVIYIYDIAQQRNIYVNREVVAFLGYTSDEVITRVDQSLATLMHPDDLEQAIQHFQQFATLSDGTICEFEYRMRHKNGEWRWFSSRDTVFKRDAEGRVTQILGNAQDITSRKQAEQEISRSRDLREAIFNESADALFLVDPETLLTMDCNDRAVEMFEAVDKAELIAIEGHTLQRSQFTAKELEEIVSDINTQGFWSREVEYVTRRGNCFWGNLAAKRITVAGRSLNLVRVTDISDRKRAEVALRQSEATNRALIAAIPDLLIRMDAEGHYQIINTQNVRVLSPSLPRENPTIHDVIPADVVEQRLSNVRLAMATDSLQMYEQTIEMDGQSCYEEVRIVPLLGQEVLCIIRDVTERKRIEAERKQAELALQQLNEELEQRVQQRTQALQTAYQQLRDSEARFQTFMDNSPTASWISDVRGVMVYASQTYYRLFQLSTTDILGKSVFDLYPAAIAQQFFDNAQTVHKTGQVLETIEMAPRLDGTLGQFLVYKFPITDSSGAALIAGVATDITEHMQAEQALRESEQRYQTLAAAAPVGIYRTDIDGHCLYVNERWCQIAGLTPAEASGTGWVRAIHPDDRDIVFQAWNRFVETRTVFRLEYRFQQPDGTSTWVFGQAVQEVDEQGAVKGYVGTITDISDRKRVEEERQWAEASLQRSERDLRTVFNNVYDAIFIHELDGQIIDCNDRALELHHATREAILTSTVAEISAPDAPLDQIASVFQRVQAGEMLQFEWKCRRLDDGSLFDTEVSVRQVILGDRPVVLAGVRDIRDRKQAERALRESEERFRTLFEATPTPIQGYDRERRVIFWNRASEELYGYTCAEALGKRVEELIIPEPMWADILPIVDRWIAGIGDPLPNGELALRNQRGETVAVYSSHLLLTNLNGDREMYCIDVDLRDRKQAEARLQEQEQFLRSIYEGVNQPIFVGDVLPDNTIRVVGWNPVAERLSGKSSREIAGKTVAEIFGADDAVEILQRYQQCIADRQAVTFEERLTLQDQTQWMLSTYNPLINQEGRVYRVVGTVYDITDRKQAELALQDSEERFRQLAENVGEVFWLTTLESKLLYVSPVFEQVWGRSPDWLYAPMNNLLDTLHPDDRSWVQQYMKAKPDGSYDLEYRILRPDGEVRWIRDRAFLIRNEAGEVYRIGGIAADITERRRTEKLIRDREVRFRSVVESNMLGIGFWDENSVTYANEALLSMLGYTMEELQQGLIDWQSLTPPEYWQKDQEASLQIQAMGACIPYEKEYLRKDGRRIPILMGGGHFEDDTQRGAFFVLDIRDRKQAELALRESQQFAQSIADKTPAALYIYDLGNQCNLYSNRSILDLLGYTSTEIQSMGANVIPILLHPEDQPKLAQHHQALTQAADGDDLELEYRMRHANGEWRWFYSRDSVFKRNEQGRVTQYIGAAQDITERKQLEQQLRQINAELERRVEERTLDLQKAMEAAEAANRAKSTFLANMSHELRTPLNAILGFAQLMNRDRSLDTEKREQLNIINRSGKHLLNLINDILEMSKIEAGRIQFNPTCFDLHNLLDTLEEMFYLRAIEKNLRLAIDRASTIPQCIRTDENKLRQVLINLLSNAIKFTQQGGVTLRITIEQIVPQTGQPQDPAPRYAACHEFALTFAVEDTGIGIDSSEIEAVFEPFIQSEKRQSQEGTGLGLPISRQFVQLMGGNLELYSIAEIGSTFTFTIPVHGGEASDTPTSPLSRPILSIASDQPSYRILVVEDHETNRQLLVQLLQSVGFEVQAAVNGQDAIALWQTWQPHLIWMDMRMPVMDGYAATQKIRAMEREQGSREAGEQGSNQSENPLIHPPTHPPTHSSTHPPTHSSTHPPIHPSTPPRLPSPTIIIALTANAFEEERARVLNMGCNDFMRKPFQETELLEKIADYLDVQYRYAEPDEKPLIQASAPFDAIATLRTLSPNQLNQLHQATLELDNVQLTHLAAQIAAEQPMLAKLIMEKIENFELQQIFDWLQAAMQGDG